MTEAQYLATFTQPGMHGLAAGDGQKRCCACGQARPLRHFYVDLYAADGVYPWCVICANKPIYELKAAKKSGAETRGRP